MATSVYSIRAKDVMSRDMVTINAKDTVHDALQLMAENKVSALPVVDRNGQCIGIVSTSDIVDVTRDLEEGLDILDKAEELNYGQFVAKLGDGVGHQLVSELMSNAVVSTKPDTRLAEAASQMLRERVHRLPVIDNQQRLIGILSTTDILTALVDHAHAEV